MAPQLTMDRIGNKKSDRSLIRKLRKRGTFMVALLVLLFIRDCSKEFLEITPNGELSQAVLANYEGVNALLIGAYSMLDGVAEGAGGWESATSGWGFCQHTRS